MSPFYSMPIAASIRLGVAAGAVAGGGVLAAAVGLNNNSTIEVPLSIAFSVGVSVFSIGMWISGKLTKVEDRISTLETGLKESVQRLSELPCQNPECPRGKKCE